MSRTSDRRSRPVGVQKEASRWRAESRDNEMKKAVESDACVAPSVTAR
jgi:hypothetical protein